MKSSTSARKKAKQKDQLALTAYNILIFKSRATGEYFVAVELSGISLPGPVLVSIDFVIKHNIQELLCDTAASQAFK